MQAFSDASMSFLYFDLQNMKEAIIKRHLSTKTAYAANTSHRCKTAMRAHAAPFLQVGVMHTNYRELGRRIAGPLVVPFLHAMVATLCAIHCHKVTLHRLTTTLLSL